MIGTLFRIGTLPEAGPKALALGSALFTSWQGEGLEFGVLIGQAGVRGQEGAVRGVQFGYLVLELLDELL